MQPVIAQQGIKDFQIRVDIASGQQPAGYTLFAAALTEPEVLELEGIRVCEAIARHAQSPGQSTSFSNSIPELFQLVHFWWFGVSSCFVSSACRAFTAWGFFRRGCPKEAGRR